MTGPTHPRAVGVSANAHPPAHRAAAGREFRSRSPFLCLAGSIRLLLVILSCVACSSSRQSVTDLNDGLAWFVPPDRAEGWPVATQAGARLERSPTVVIAWSSTATRDAAVTVDATRMAREHWIAAIKEKLERSGARALPSPPDTFEEGVTLAGLRQLATDRGADVIVLFGLETAKRQYHAFEPMAGARGGTADVANVVEVVTLAKAVGVSSTGVPLFADTQKGFASAESHVRTVEELEETSHRVAVDAVAEAVVRRLNDISPGKDSK